MGQTPGQTTVLAFTAQTLAGATAAAEREAFMHKSLVFLVVAFNMSIQTKTFLYENSLNYYHLKFGLTQASLIRIQFCFLQILAATELLTQLILVVGGWAGVGASPSQNI